jgi:hypothetical protein
MTLLTIVDIRNRVMALCELITLPSPYSTGDAYVDEDECSWDTDDFPAYVVEESGRGSEYEYNINADPCAYLTRDTIRIILYLAHICDESYAKDFDNIDYANRCKAAVIQFFAKRQTLALTSPMFPPLVEKAQILRATSPHTGVTHGSVTKNRIVVFNMTVEYLNYA